MLFYISAKRNRRMGLLFLASFLVMVLLTVAWNRIYYYESGMISDYELSYFRQTAVDKRQIFADVLCERSTVYAYVGMMGLLLIGDALYWLLAAWAGGSFGFVLTSCVLKYGTKGTLLFLTFIFPQFLIYIPVFLMLLTQSEGMWQYIFKRDNSVIKRPYTRKQVGVRYMLLFGMGWAFIMVGCLAESYANVELLKWVLNFF